jgi:hypothetical protein
MAENRARCGTLVLDMTTPGSFDINKLLGISISIYPSTARTTLELALGASQEARTDGCRVAKQWWELHKTRDPCSTPCVSLLKSSCEQSSCGSTTKVVALRTVDGLWGLPSMSTLSAMYEQTPAHASGYEPRWSWLNTGTKAGAADASYSATRNREIEERPVSWQKTLVRLRARPCVM